MWMAVGQIMPFQKICWQIRSFLEWGSQLPESLYQSACKSHQIKSYVDPKPQFPMESVNGPKPHPRDECHSSGQVLKVCVPVPFVPVGRQK